MKAGIILLTAPQPAGACFILPVQRQSGTIKTAGSMPGPILHTTAPTQTLTDASHWYRAETARRQGSWTEEPRCQKEAVLLGQGRGHSGRDLCNMQQFL